MLSSSNSPIPWVDTAHLGPPDISNLQPFASITDISQALRLNLDQHFVFETATRKLLSHFTDDIVSESQNNAYKVNQQPCNKQLVGYVGGEAGSGKSEIISGILTMARLWGRRNTVETMASTGLAGILVEGDTIHFNRSLTIGLEKQYSMPVKKQIRRVYLTIVDEVSMAGQELMGSADEVTRTVRNEMTKAWGGVDILMFGDWLQLPPVAGRALYQPPDDTHNKSRSVAGYNLWLAINFVVFLTEVWRQRHDQQYLAILGRMHWGINTQHDIDQLNRQSVGELNQRDIEPIESVPYYFAPIVTDLNLDRVANIKQGIMQHCKKFNKPVYQILAESSNQQNSTRLKRVAGMIDDKTSKIPLTFTAYISMPIMITKRMKKFPALENLKLIANGTLGFIYDITPNVMNGSTDEDLFTTSMVDDVIIKKYKLMPLMIWIKLRGVEKLITPGYPLGVVGIPPWHGSVKIQEPHVKNWAPTLTQFAMISALSITPEKLQGISLPYYLFMGCLDRSGISAQACYVCYSRVLAMKWLVLTEALSLEYFHKFVPPIHVLEAMKHLMTSINYPSYMTTEQTAHSQQWLQTQLQYCDTAMASAHAKRYNTEVEKNAFLQKKHRERNSTLRPLASLGRANNTIPLTSSVTYINKGAKFTPEQVNSHGNLTTGQISEILHETNRCFLIHLG